MGIPRTAYDYCLLADNRGFFWLGPFPQNTGSNTKWQCQYGHVWEARYNSIWRGTGCPHCTGAAKKTPNDYVELAGQRGFSWLGPFPKTAKLKTKWQCPKGHIWETSYGSLRGCPHCSNHVPKTEVDYHELASEKSLTWLGPFPQTTQVETTWQCVANHTWSATYNEVQQGKRCPHCGGKYLAKRENDYIQRATAKGIIWVGPFPDTTMDHTTWRCHQGHEWKAAYQHVKGCPHCSGYARKTVNDYHQLAEQRNLKWLGPEVSSANSNTNWLCHQGHVWNASYSRVAIYGCLYCAGTAPKTPDDYHTLAKAHNFSWLGPEVPSTDYPTKWQCANGHTWESAYSNVRTLRNCPACIDVVNGHKVSRPQRELCKLVNGELNVYIGLKSADVAIEREGVQIAIEYDSWYWHAGQEEYDKKRDEYLASKGWCILHVKSNDALPSLDQLNTAIATLLAGETYAEIILDDWGKGPTFHGPD